MSDIRFNRWLHQSGTGGVYQASSGNVGIGTSVPSTTLDVNGSISATSITATTGTITGNLSVGGVLTYEDVTNIDAVGVVTARNGIDVTSGHINLVDNSKIRVGTGDDLQIYHDGNHSRIVDSGTGNLVIQSNRVDIQDAAGAEHIAIFQSNGSVDLYHNNVKKFETTSAGIKVSGSFPDITIHDTDTTNDNFRILHNGGGTQLLVDPNNVGPNASHFIIGIDGTEKLRINSAGKMILGTASNLGSVPPKFTIVNDTNSSTFSECQLLRLNGPGAVGERGGIGFHYAQSLNYGEKPSSFIGAEVVAPGGAQQTDLLFATRPNTTDSEPTERVRISSTGNVGIGTENPLNRVDIVQSDSRTRVTSFGHIISQNHNHSTTNYWSIAPRNGGELDIAYGPTDSDGTVTADLVTIKTDGKIGINETSPNGNLHIGNLPTGSGNVNVVTLDRDDGTLIYGIDYNGSSNLVSFTGNNKQFAFANKSGSAEAVRILNTGGLTFNGDTAQANALDDYEYGTLDWRLQRSNAIGSGSNTDTVVRYTKIGNRVYVSGYVYTQNTGNSTGTTVELRNNSNTSQVATLPYVPNHHGGFPITGTRTIDDTYRNMAVTFRSGQTQVYIYKDDGDNDYIKNKNNVNISSSQTHLVIQFCGSYTTAS